MNEEDVEHKSDDKLLSGWCVEVPLSVWDTPSSLQGTETPTVVLEKTERRDSANITQKLKCIHM